jgi:hypothetical protein
LRLAPVAIWVALLISHTQVGLQFIEGTHADDCFPEYFRRNCTSAFVLINPLGPAFFSVQRFHSCGALFLTEGLGGDAGRGSAARSVARCFLTPLGAWSLLLA